MDLLLLILISGGAVIGSSIFAYSLLKSGAKAIGTSATTGLISDVTGMNKSSVQSLVGSKPYASEPGNAEAVSDAITKTAKGGKIIAGLASKIPGPIGAAAGAAMIGFGATAAVGEAVTKPGLRAISSKATKIANGAKLRFTGSKMGKSLISGKNKLSAGLDSVKNGLTDFGDEVKNAVNDINQGIKNSAPVRGAIKGVKILGQTRDNLANSLANTWGYNTLIRNGKELIGARTRKRHGGEVRIYGPSRDPLLGNFTGAPGTSEKMAEIVNMSNSEITQPNIPKTYKSETLSEFIKAKREGNRMVMGSYYAKEYAEAKELLENSSDSKDLHLKHKMMLDVVRNSSKDMNKEELLSITDAMYDNYIDKQGNILKKAQKAAEEKNEQVALETVENFFGKKGGKNSELTERLNNYIKESFNPANDEETKKLRKETFSEIASDLNGIAAKAVLTDEEIGKIRNSIESKSNQNIQFEVAKIENKQVQQYRDSNPDTTLAEARHQVEKQNDEQNYKKALEEALETVEARTATNIGQTSNIDNTRQEGNIQPIQQIQQTQQTQQTQQIVQQSIINNTVEQTTENHIPNTQTSAIDNSSARNNVATERVIERVVETKVDNSVINKQTTSIDSNTIDQIANQVANKTIIPFNEAVSKSVDWVKKLGGGDLDRGANRLAETMNNLNNGSNANMPKYIEKMFKDLGNGSPEFGAKYLERAIRNLEEGKNKPILGDSDKNELLYAIANLIQDNENEPIKTLSRKSRKRAG